MDSILQQITDWLKEMLVEAIMGNLSGLFDSVNNQVGEIASDVGMTPANFSPGVFAMIRNISENVIIPIAGLILTFIVCHELIQLIIDHNNLANFETWIFFKWVFKTFVAVMLITNTFNITMAVFDVSQHVVNASAGIISGSTAVDASALEAMEDTLNAMEIGPLLGLFLQSFIVQVTMSILSVVIFVIVYGRMVEIYLMTSLAPIPFSTFGNREQSQIGQNYLRSLFALGFQGFLIILCVGLQTRLIPLASVRETGIFLIEIMPLMFIPAMVGLLDCWPDLQPVLLPIAAIIMISTFVVMIVAGHVTQATMSVSGKKGK